MTEALIVCLCPTYKRPELLRNSIACFLSQTYPNKFLLILDDAGQHAQCDFPDQRWRLISQTQRYPNLPAKFNAIAAMMPNADIYAVWEDDDIYLPHHLAAIAEAASRSSELAYFAPKRVLSTYNVPRGHTREENSNGVFHASWAYTRNLWNLLGGYSLGERLDYDQQMGARCRALVGTVHYDESETGRRFGPSYVYRWGNGVYNGSEAGEEGFENLWRRLGDLPFERIEATGPRMDKQTSLIHARYGWVRHCAQCGMELTEIDQGYCARCREVPAQITVKAARALDRANQNSLPNRSICLVMLVKDEASIIERCLASVRDSIDCWIIMDTGSCDDTRAKATRILAGIPGEYLSKAWRDFSTNRNSLLDLSRDKAEYALFLDADETLVLDAGKLCDGLDAAVHGIEMKSSRGSFLLPRLIRRDARVRFVGTIAETLVGMDSIDPIDGVSIRHHEDGLRWRDPARDKRAMLHIESALLDDPNDPDLTLALAECHACQREWGKALDCYRERAMLGGDEAKTWYALYRAAQILDESGEATPLVIEAYLAAYDFRPTKAEPLVRIAKRCLREKNYELAAEIAQMALATPFEDKAHFFEPEIYLGQREIVYLSAMLGQGRYDEVVESAAKLLDNFEEPTEIQLELEELRRIALARQSEAPDFESVAPSKPLEKPAAIPLCTPRGEKYKLCIGMATYDDYDGVYFSIQAIRLFHAEIADQIELMVIDNNPSGKCAEGLKKLEESVPNYRYVPEIELRGTAATRDLIFREANSDFVLVMDCHVLFVPGALKRLLDYFEANPACRDLLQGPLLSDDLVTLFTHFEAVWRDGMYGIWSGNQRGADPEGPPFEIPMQGLGAFACRKDAWPGFNPRFQGFGGEEGYIHEKFRQAGAKALCLPFLRWVHRFHRPLGAPYAPDWADRVRNYMIGFQELGLDPKPLEEHFNQELGAAKAAATFAWVKNELQSPFYSFDVVYYCPKPDSAQDPSMAHAVFQKLGLNDRVITRDWVSLNPSQGERSLELARILTHRGIIERAKLRALQNVLVIEEPIDFQQAVLRAGSEHFKQLHSHAWHVLLVKTEAQSVAASFCAIAYHASVFDRILEEISPQPARIEETIAHENGWYDYLKKIARSF